VINAVSVLNDMVYQAKPLTEVIEFIEANRRVLKPSYVNRLIMIHLRNGANINLLINLALNYKDTFFVRYEEIYDHLFSMKNAVYTANLLIRSGIPKDAFINYDKSMLTDEPYKSKIDSEELTAIKKDDVDAFIMATSSSFDKRPRGMSYLSWSALLGASRVFQYLLSHIELEPETIRIAIEKGNATILDTLIENEIDFHPFMSKLIQYHRNGIIEITMRDEDINNQGLINVAIRNLNARAITMLQRHI
jgi:hypothetical protein